MCSHRRLIGLLFIILVLAPWAETRGVILFPKGQDEPVVGRLLGHQGPKYTVRIKLPDGEELIREFFDAELDSVLITVSPERLGGLDPQNPEAYRDYAEELAEKRKDPDARDAAKTLYLIAAYLAPDTLGRSCLLGMIPLADNDGEQRRFRAMAFVLDPRHDRTLLPKTKAPPPKPDEATADGERILLKALREFRRGNTRLARTLIDQDRVKQVMARFQDIISFEELYRAEYETPPETMYKMLKLELRLARGPDAGTEQNAADTAAWSEIAKDGIGEPAPTLNLETLTDIDPRKCLYRNGKWITPDAARTSP